MTTTDGLNFISFVYHPLQYFNVVDGTAVDKNKF